MKVKHFMDLVKDQKNVMVELFLPPYERQRGSYVEEVHEMKYNIYDDLSPYYDRHVKKFRKHRGLAYAWQISDAITGNETKADVTYQLYLK